MIKGQAGQVVNAMVYDPNGNPYGGPVTVFVDGDNTGQALGQTNAGVATLRGNGSYSYITSAGDVGFNHVCFTFVPASGFNVDIQIDLVTQAQITAMQTATGLTSIVVHQMLINAAAELRVVRWGGSLEPGVAAGMLYKLNSMLDLWNAAPNRKYAVNFTSYTPALNQNLQTLGPASAQWVTTARPDRIIGANVILNTVTPAVRIPIEIRDRKWWLDETVRGLAVSIVTDLYYDPQWPNGNVNLWPAPTANYPIELETDQLFSAYGDGDVLWLPFGYQRAIELSLAEACASSLGQTASIDLKSQAEEARAICFENNEKQQRNIRTRDGGMPGSTRGGRYLYRDGRVHRG